MSMPTEPPPTDAIAFGYKEDRPDPRDYAAEEKLGVGADVGSLSASMIQHRGPRLLQGGANSCVLNAVARAIRMAMSASGISDPPIASRRFMYFNAIRQEAREAAERGEDPPPMRDEGCYARLALRAVQKLGFPPETLFPYDDRPDFILEVPPTSLYRASIDMSGLQYARINTAGSDRARVVAASLLQGKPVIFGISRAGPKFVANRGELITEPDEAGAGHMLAALEVDEDGNVKFDNWWFNFGLEGGMGIMTAEVFGSPWVRDVYSIEHVEAYEEEGP